ncbi:HD domain-containing phosphohydrolase [Legionella pneumophila]|nr:HD domain-containing phosphohydrolase [Legionella pneumophila]MDW9144085.1 HD domain-containing phosphohydrolase [Legionella pneumophila]MDW9158746.1 HD domain-containing phosphohydrolase [Legionella pneumophila]MDW9162453.1 HD domain-containing phosphohydrolase [Legionella pneumophila]HAT9680543.1 PAS domain S-box protein [Legionella pneumophila subsp. pneumophila]
MNARMTSHQQSISEDRYLRLFETAQDGILILDPLGKVLDANPYFSSLSGYSVAELIGKYIWDLGFIKSIPDNKAKFKELRKKGYVRYENLPIKTKQGEEHSVEFISNSYFVGHNKFIQCNIRDITYRVELQKISAKLNKLYETMIRCNQALHENTIHSIFSKLSKILISVSEFQAVWINYSPLNSKKFINPIAVEGLNKDYFDMLNFNVQKKNKGLIANAIYLHELFVSQDLQHNEQDAVERKLDLKFGLSSAVVIPINSQKKSSYALVIYGRSGQKISDEFVVLLQNLADDITLAINNIESQEERAKLQTNIEASLSNTIEAIASMVEKRDLYTAGHQHRVADLARVIAIDMGLSQEQIKGLYMACGVHDVGKIIIPAEILSKPGKLSVPEYEIIKAHPEAGWSTLKNIDFPWPIAEIVYQHHERLDGSGYPRGLKGNEVLLESRILAVADVVEAMASHRPYRPALGILIALQEVMQHKGLLYDERVVESCVKLFIEKQYEFK